MFSAFFGHYLLEKGIVTAKQLNKALNIQDHSHLKIGTLAISTGYLTANQVEELHMAQLTCDKRFGELAIEADYMTEKQLDELLATQKSESLLLAQVLVDMDILTYEEYEQHVLAYQKEHTLTDADMKSLENNDAEHITNTFLHFDDNNSDHYHKYVTLFLNNFCRFIDTHVRLDGAQAVDRSDYEQLIRQSIDGESPIFTAIAGDTYDIIQFAGRYANERFECFGEYPVDATGEFLNLTNGLFLVNLSNEGTECSIDIQTHIESPILNPYRPLYDIPIHSDFGTVHLILGQL